MSVVQGESRMAWPILQEDNYSRGQAAVDWEKTGAVDVISAGKQAGLAAAPCRSLAFIRGSSFLRMALVELPTWGTGEDRRGRLRWQFGRGSVQRVISQLAVVEDGRKR